MNLMRKLHQRPPLWAPQDDAAAAPVEAEPSGDAAPVGQEAPVGQDAAPAAPDFSFLPEEFRAGDKPDIEGFRARYDDLAAQHAQRQEALADVPEDASGYEFAVPDDLDFGDLDLPEGFGFDLKADDPAIKPVFDEFGAFLHKHGLPKVAAKEAMGLLAKYRAAEYAPLYAQSKAEMKALGAAADSRIANVDRVLASRLPESQAKAVRALTTTADGVKALEALLAPRGMKTGNTPPAAARTVNDDLAAYYKNPAR
jgi:hypothetical protein